MRKNSDTMILLILKWAQSKSNNGMNGGRDGGKCEWHDEFVFFGNNE